MKLISSALISAITLAAFTACATTTATTTEKAPEATAAAEHPAKDASKAPSTEVFDSPESAHWHPETRSWFVSSMGGPDILAKDGYGWISRLDENGKVISARWVQKGFHAPSGICHVGMNLYVADRDGLAEVDINKAELVRKIELPGAQFPNDTACDKEGNVFVTDMSGNKIYRWKKGMDKAEVWLASADLDTPNGIHVEGKKMYFVSWGPITNPATSETSRPGYLRSIDMKTKKINKGTGIPVGNMDGVTVAGKTVFATDWMGGRIIRFDKNEKPTVFMKGLSHIADLGYSPELKVIAVPEMSTNRVYFIDVK